MVFPLLNKVGENLLCHVKEGHDAAPQQEPQVPSKVRYIAVEVVGVVLLAHLVSSICVENVHGNH